MLHSLDKIPGKFYDGYRYYKHKSTKNKTWWRCEYFRKGCNGWGFEQNGKFMLTQNHNHKKCQNLLEIEYDI